MRILGIDPGLRLTGYGCVELIDGRHEPTLVEGGVLRLDADRPIPHRLLQLHEDLLKVIDELSPQVMVVEKLYSHYRHATTSVLMGHARGVICLVAAQAEIPVFDYAATQVKKLLTGNGRAPKVQMQQAIQREFGLAELPEPADVADALAIALCHYYLSRNIAAIDVKNGIGPKGRSRKPRTPRSQISSPSA